MSRLLILLWIAWFEVQKRHLLSNAICGIVHSEFSIKNESHTKRIRAHFG